MKLLYSELINNNDDCDGNDSNNSNEGINSLMQCPHLPFYWPEGRGCSRVCQCWFGVSKTFFLISKDWVVQILKDSPSLIFAAFSINALQVEYHLSCIQLNKSILVIWI